MKVKVHNNSMYCSFLDTRINHIECNDECPYFVKCEIEDDAFVIECGYLLREAQDLELIRTQI